MLTFSIIFKIIYMLLSWISAFWDPQLQWIPSESVLALKHSLDFFSIGIEDIPNVLSLWSMYSPFQQLSHSHVTSQWTLLTHCVLSSLVFFYFLLFSRCVCTSTLVITLLVCFLWCSCFFSVFLFDIIVLASLLYFLVLLSPFS